MKGDEGRVILVCVVKGKIYIYKLVEDGEVTGSGLDRVNKQ